MGDIAIKQYHQCVRTFNKNLEKYNYFHIVLTNAVFSVYGSSSQCFKWPILLPRIPMIACVVAGHDPWAARRNGKVRLLFCFAMSWLRSFHWVCLCSWWEPSGSNMFLCVKTAVLHSHCFYWVVSPEKLIQLVHWQSTATWHKGTQLSQIQSCW